MSNSLKVSNLYKSYGDNQVLKGISFEVSKGEIFALLGTNGAGKTTTLECIEELKNYDNGKISLCGKIGVQLQSSSLPKNMKILEALNLFAKWNNSEIDTSLIEKLTLTPLLKRQYKELSIGQKRRLHLALSLIGNPDIIFLDEPTAGLDVEGRLALHDEIKNLKSKGKTIVITSHDMAEIASLCDRLAILKDGEIVFIGTPHELTSKTSKLYKIKLKLSSKLLLENNSKILFKSIDQGYYTFEINKIDEGLLELLTCAKSQNIDVYDVKIEQATLEECFINIARGESNE
ncbi:ATP-binding cassette domain-containing protein [Clostridium perfringens]|nr:ATP-binding cassette domain-containing protein [Clostridium perfringens]